MADNNNNVAENENKPEKRVLEGVNPLTALQGIISTLGDNFSQSNSGWLSFEEAMDNGGFVMFNEAGEPKVIDSMMPFFTNANAFVDAALNGRLFFTKKGTNDLVRVEVGNVAFNNTEISFVDEPERKFGIVQEEPVKEEVEVKREEPVVEDPEKQATEVNEVVAKPKAPSFLFFKRIANALFGGYKEELNQYDARMEQYDDYQNKLIIQAEEKREPIKGLKQEAPNSLNFVLFDDILKSLKKTYENKKTLNPEFSEKYPETMKKLNDVYHHGVERRYDALSALNKGEYGAYWFDAFKDSLGDAMLGELVRRGVQDGNAKSKEAFIKSAAENPEQLKELKEKMLDTPAVRKVLKQGAEGFGSAMSSSITLGKLVNDAILQTSNPVAVIDNNNPEKTNIKTHEKKNDSPVLGGK